MRNKLSYYSVILLVGLAIVSAFVFVLNPFNGAPASASPGSQAVNAPNAAIASGPSSSTAIPPGTIAGNSSILQPGGTFDGDHHHQAGGFFASGGVPGNGTVTTTTTTTTTNSVYSQNE